MDLPAYMHKFSYGWAFEIVTINLNYEGGIIMENEVAQRKGLRVGMPIYVIKESKIEKLITVALFEDFLIARSELDELSLFLRNKIHEDFYPTRYFATHAFFARSFTKLNEEYMLEASKHVFEPNLTLPVDFDAHAAIMAMINADLPPISIGCISSGKTNEHSCKFPDSLEFCKSEVPMRTGRVSLNKCRMCPALRNFIEAPEHCQFHRDRYNPDEPSVSLRMKSFQTDALRESNNAPVQNQDTTDWSKSEIDVVRKCVQNGGTND